MLLLKTFLKVGGCRQREERARDQHSLLDISRFGMLTDLRKQCADETRLQHEAAWALVSCFFVMSERGSTSLESIEAAAQLFSMTWNSADDAQLRAIAAETAVALCPRTSGM